MENSDYITCAQAAKLCIRQPSPATVWRWITKGVESPKGRIYLRSIREGGKVFTTREWLDEYREASAVAHQVEPIAAPVVHHHARPVTPSRRAKQIAEAKRELAAR